MDGPARPRISPDECWREAVTMAEGEQRHGGASPGVGHWPLSEDFGGVVATSPVSRSTVSRPVVLNPSLRKGVCDKKALLAGFDVMVKGEHTLHPRVYRQAVECMKARMCSVKARAA